MHDVGLQPAQPGQPARAERGDIASQRCGTNNRHAVDRLDARDGRGIGAQDHRRDITLPGLGLRQVRQGIFDAAARGMEVVVQVDHTDGCALPAGWDRHCLWLPGECAILRARYYRANSLVCQHAPVGQV